MALRSASSTSTGFGDGWSGLSSCSSRPGSSERSFVPMVDIEEPMNLLVLGQGSEPVLLAAASDESAHESCSMSLFDSSTQLGHIRDEASRKVYTKMSEPDRRLMSYLDRLPVCASRSEALQTAFVFVLHVNPSKSEDTVQEQLSHYGYILNELRQQNRRLRPSRALLLVRTDNGEAERNRQDSWEEELEEFELVHGNIRKCGPVAVDDAVGIRGIFQDIAMSRKSRRFASHGSDSEGSCTSEPPARYEAEREDQDLSCRPDLFEALRAIPRRGRISL
eukprot:CAMPEP_0170594660 /NCGR_PEP_ID=MMETSP0224-20130122/14123_1 /TAXON_ID=285029 /ORGANISM="Togula jolla, Strain CCCM 725" /LENGTH=277 /DNA_ID=CAMNT_0010918741 /DNA_START=78 /DNA_END=911 /DNA_ORIENTATION=+